MKKLENQQELEHWNCECLDLGKSLEFEKLDLDFEDLKIENFGYLNFEKVRILQVVAKEFKLNWFGSIFYRRKNE